MLCIAPRKNGQPCTYKAKKHNVCVPHLDWVGLHVDWRDIPDLQRALRKDLKRHEAIVRRVLTVTSSMSEREWSAKIGQDFGDNLCIRPAHPNEVSKAFLDSSDDVKRMMEAHPDVNPGLIDDIAHRISRSILDPR